jgi:virulence-associated protein VagC
MERLRQTLHIPKGTAMADAIINISRIGTETILVPVAGTAPLIVNRFSEKAKRQMLDNMLGRKSPKQNKNPEAEYEAAFYRLGDGGYGFPALAFKAATVSGARNFAGVTMTALKQYMFFRGEIGSDGRGLVRIDGEPKMREDVVTVGRNGSDLRYRPQFLPWTATLRVTYVTSALTKDSVLSLIEAGGQGVGVGEWRPERDGDFGTYILDPERPVDVVRGARELVVA